MPVTSSGRDGAEDDRSRLEQAMRLDAIGGAL
jgi:hypothetical protein